MWLPLLSGVCAAAVVGNNQLSVGPTLTYYFWKIGIAVLLVAVSIIAAGLAVRATGLAPGSWTRGGITRLTGA
jgi:hypothetical protein